MISKCVWARLADGFHAVAVAVSDHAGNPAQAHWGFTTDVTPPTVAITAPAGPVVTVPQSAIGLVYSDATSGVDLNSLRVAVDGADMTARCNAGPSAAGCVSPTLAAGAHSLSASIRDRAGNAAAASLAFQVVLDATPPSITIATPVEGSFLANPRPPVVASYSDPDSPVDPASVRLNLDGNDVTANAQVAAGSVTFTPAAALTDGTHSVVVVARDPAGNATPGRAIINLNNPAVARFTCAHPQPALDIQSRTSTVH